MQKKPLVFKDFSGGLNNRDTPSELAANEFQRHENRYNDTAGLNKRGGMNSLLNELISPVPFTVDGNTVGLWHFDEAAAPWADSGANGYNLNPIYTGPVSGTGIFPSGAPLGAVFTPTAFATDHGPIFKAVSAPLNTLAELTIQGWVNINPAFSGQPLQIARFGTFYNVSSSGAVVWGTCALAPDGLNPGDLVNGLAIKRDWDAVSNKNASDPYVEFTLRTNGTAGTVTTIRTAGLSTAKAVYIKAAYNSSSGLMRLWVDGQLVATDSPFGGGTVDDSLAKVISAGAGLNQSYLPALPALPSSGILGVFAMAVNGTTLYLVGNFATILGQTRNNAAAIDINTGALLPWNPNLSSAAYSILITNNLIYIGGNFLTVNGATTRRRACAVDLVNGIATGWNPDCQGGGHVFALEAGPSSIFLGGDFTSFNGGASARKGLGEVDLTNGTATAFNPVLNNPFVLAMKYSAGTLYVGGAFATVNSGATARNNACALNTTTSVATAWDPNLDSEVDALLIIGSTVYLAGQFSSANGGTARVGACAVDGAAGTLTAWNPNLTYFAAALATDGNVIFIGGDFNTAGGMARAGLVSVDTVAGTPNGWNPKLGAPSTPLARVIIVENGVIIFAGSFDTIDGTATGSLGAWQTPLYNVFNGTLDEWKVSNVEDLTFPFQKARPGLMTFSKSDGTNQIVLAAGPNLYFSIGDGVFSQINGTSYDVIPGESYSSVAHWDGKQMGDALFLTNGVDAPKCWDGLLLRPWGEGTVPLYLLGQGSGAAPQAGPHTYVYTFLYGSPDSGPAVETGPSVPTVFASASTQNIVISNIALGSPGCTGRRVYKLASDELYYLIRTIDDNTTISMAGGYVAGSTPGPLTDTGSDGIEEGTGAGQLRSGSYPQMAAEVLTAAVPFGQYLALNYDTIFSAGMANEPFYTRFCELGTPHVFLNTSFITAKADKGSINALAVSQGELIASKGGLATLVLRGSDRNQWEEFETLHPAIGCIDHFAYVLHTLSKDSGQTDQTMLVFPAADGHWYRYFGYDFQRISDKIGGTVDNLAQTNSSRLEWDVTTQAQFLASLSANAGGTASANINSPIYSVDGLRETPGKIKLVNQLDYIGMWGGSSGSTTVTGTPGGHVIAIAKGPSEGLFYFSFDSDNRIWTTTDNFLTITAISAPGGFDAADRLVEIVYASIAGQDQYLCFTGGTGSGGAVYAYNGTIDTWALINAGPFYLQADVLAEYISSFYKNFQINFDPVPNTGQGHETFLHHSKDIYRLGNGGGFPGGAIDFKGDANIYLTHNQAILINTLNSEELHGGSQKPLNRETQSAIRSADLAYGADVDILDLNTKTLVYSGRQGFWTAGYYGLHDDLSYSLPLSGVGSGSWLYTSTDGFKIQLTRRETAFWQGGNGTFKPQTFWDIATQAIYFTAGVAPDVNGNTIGHIYKLTMAGVLTSVVSSFSHYALATDGLKCYFTDQLPDTAGSQGFIPSLKSFALADPTVITTIAALSTNFLPLRLLYNPTNATLYCGGKSFPQSKDAFDHQGLLVRLAPTTGALTPLKTFIASDNVGPFPIELVYQTTTPFSVFAATQNVLFPNSEAINAISVANVISQPLAFSFDEGVGVRSNLIFVPSSGPNGNFLWSDRLYYSNRTSATTGDGWPVQLGVPGVWTIQGNFYSEKKNLGVFTAFDNFQSLYQGDVQFSLANASTPGGLTNFTPVAPNQKITIYPAPQPYAQWLLAFTWVYDATLNPNSPNVGFVLVGQFLGASTIPRVVGGHWKGRSYWSVANNGETNNSLVCVLQRNLTWMLITGWQVSAFAIFRSQFVATSNYDFVQLETGHKDLGSIIRGVTVFGNIMNDPVDKMIEGCKAVVAQFVNQANPLKNGYIQIVPYQSGQAMQAAAWAIALPAVLANPDQQQVLGVPNSGTFPYQWQRAFAIGIQTSTDTTGNFVPVVDQPENISELIIDLIITEPEYQVTVL